MKLRHSVAAVAAAGIIVVTPTAAPARPMAGPVAHVASSCISATIDGAHKCLRAGEFCTHAYDHRAPHHWPYTHYGFRCIKFYSNVDRYRLTYA
jgi:hypothetical protein